MTFGPDHVLICPYCRNVFIRNTLGSGNSFGAHIWSDGKMLAPMMPLLPIIVWCGNCRHYFFIEDAEEVGPAPLGTFMSEPFVINTWDDMQIDDYRTALEDEIYTETIGTESGAREAHDKEEERERSLRIRLWWLLNDTIRHTGDSIDPALYAIFIDNLRRLDTLTAKASSPEGRLMRAEVLREVGQTEDSLELLESIIKDCDEDNDMEWIKSRAGKIKSFALQGIRQVKKMAPEDQRNES